MPAPRGLVQRLDQELHRSGLLPRRGRLLVAVSGGADSVALLRLLVAINQSDFWGWTLVVGHVDHGIRGRASKEDAIFVKRLARELGLACVSRGLKLGKGASEETARVGRLRALRGMVKRKKCAGVVMAHHADDQAETVLLRLIRGCGLEGLAGIGAVSEVEGVRIFRPLLGVRREELRRYLGEIGQGWREDETNASDVYLRNRVCAEVLPQMEALGDGVVEAIGRMARLAGEAQGVVEGRVREVMGEALISGRKGKRGGRGGEVILRRGVLQRTEGLVCGEIVRVLVVAVGGTTETADFERVREAVRVIQGEAGGKEIQMGRGVVVLVGGGTVRVERKLEDGS